MTISRFAFVLSVLGVAACGNSDGQPLHAGLTDARITARRGTVIVEACQLSADQMASLGSPTMPRIVTEVVLRCLVGNSSGQLSTISGTSWSDARAQVDAIHALGYRVSYALTTNGTSTAELLASGDVLASALSDPALGVDGIEIALPVLPNDDRSSLSALVDTLSARIRPTRSLAIWAPPSVTVPSDIPGGEAYDIPHLGNAVDRVRLMTLDYSCCGAPAGPTSDSGWAVDVARLARSETHTAIDISLPLYGIRFGGSTANEVPIGYVDAIATASAERIPVTRDPRGPLTFSDGQGTWWFDDAQTTLDDLLALDPVTLPADTGIVFYGLGAEDPALWNTLSEALP